MSAGNTSAGGRGSKEPVSEQAILILPVIISLTKKTATFTKEAVVVPGLRCGIPGSWGTRGGGRRSGRRGRSGAGVPNAGGRGGKEPVAKEVIVPVVDAGEHQRRGRDGRGGGGSRGGSCGRGGSGGWGGRGLLGSGGRPRALDVEDAHEIHAVLAGGAQEELAVGARGGSTGA
jgi:hypothetical protein